MNWYTLYLNDGSKQHVQAVVNNKAIEILDGNSMDLKGRLADYEEGVKDTRKWCPVTKQWYQIPGLRLSFEEFEKLSFQEVLDIVEKNIYLEVTYLNKDSIVIEKNWGCFYKTNYKTYYVQYITVVFAEYAGGNDFYATGSTYFAPKDLPHAVTNFMERARDNPHKVKITPWAKSIDEIHDLQEVKYYNS